MDDEECYQICQFCFNPSGVFCSCRKAKESMKLEIKREFINSTFAEFNNLDIPVRGEERYFKHEIGEKKWV